MRVTLNAGPVDGRRLEIPGAQLGDILEIELHTGETHRYFVDEQCGKNLNALSIGAGWDPDLPASVIRLSERDFTESWRYDSSAAAFKRTERPGPARPNPGEILAMLMLGGALGLGAGLTVLLGWIIGETLHNWLGTWISVLIWLSSIGAVLGTIHLIAYPSFWRDPR